MGEGKDQAFSVVFEFEKVTKNTVKYAERPKPGEPARIGSLYVQKWALAGETPPRQLAVTISAGAKPQGKEGG